MPGGWFMNFLGNGGGNLIGSVIGAIQNRRFMNESYEREDTQLQRMVADAQAAGISPVAALGASGAYSQTSNYSPETSGDKIGAAVDQMFNERADLENRLLEAQISATNAEAADFLSTARSRTVAAEAAAAATTVHPNALFVEGDIGEPPISGEIAGIPFRFPDGWTAGETMEEIFGEPGEWLQGGYNLALAASRWMAENAANNAGQTLPGRAPISPYQVPAILRALWPFNEFAAADRQFGNAHDPNADLPWGYPY